ncbi:MAG: type II toxin-antitoxin system RelE/ParE family toxin [Proteobacteria bacterium]|nr:type II toxin-antitoxin system RelE/ParE family toxin [Pseudomonadota bacterium]
MKLSFRLAPRAYDDLKNSARYTRQQWGEAQREKYLRALDARFLRVAEHPHSGKHRPEQMDVLDVPYGGYEMEQDADALVERVRWHPVRLHRAQWQCKVAAGGSRV